MKPEKRPAPSEKRRTPEGKDVPVSSSLCTYYRMFVNTTPDGFLTADVNGRILEVNDAYCRMTGFTREELLTMSIPDVVAAPEDIPGHARNIVKSGTKHFEVQQRTRDGKIIEIEVIAAFMTEIRRFVCFLHDITARRQMEETIRQDKAFIECVMDKVGDPLAVFDLRGRMIRWNSAFKHVTGYRDDEVAAMWPTDFFTAEDRPRAASAFESVITKNMTAIEACMLTKHGGRIPYEFTASLLRDAKDKPFGIIITGHNIAARKAAIESLIKKKEQLEKRYMALERRLTTHDSVLIDA